MGYVTLCLGRDMVCCYNCVISGGLVYMLRYFHWCSFASYDRSYALKITQLTAISFSHTHLQVTMCKFQRVN